MENVINDILIKLKQDLFLEQQKEIMLNSFVDAKHTLISICDKNKLEKDAITSDDTLKLRDMFYLVGSNNFNKKIKDLIRIYIDFLSSDFLRKKYLNFDKIEQDIKEGLDKEIERLQKDLIILERLNNNINNLEEILTTIKNNEYLTIDEKFLKTILAELPLEQQSDFMEQVITYNNDTFKAIKEDLIKRQEERNVEVLDYPEPIKLKQPKEKKVKEEVKQNIEDEVVEEGNTTEKIELLDKPDVLSNNALVHYEAIKKMIMEEADDEEIISYIQGIKAWGTLYISEINSYCLRHMDEDLNKNVNYYLSLFIIDDTKEELEELDKQPAVILFKGYEMPTSVIEKDLDNLNNDNYLLGVKKYLTDLSDSKINIGYEGYSSSDLLKGSYHKKNIKAIRLSYEILEKNVYYVYDISVKKSDNGKKFLERVASRRPSQQEKNDVLNAFHDETKKELIIERNKEIYDNIMASIDEKTLKDKEEKSSSRGGM